MARLSIGAKAIAANIDSTIVLNAVIVDIAAIE
jgi:hypothetical protein